MTPHIGILVCFAEGAALCYKTNCAEFCELIGPNVHPEIMHPTPSQTKYVE
jgi:aspartate racemase